MFSARPAQLSVSLRATNERPPQVATRPGPRERVGALLLLALLLLPIAGAAPVQAQNALLEVLEGGADDSPEARAEAEAAANPLLAIEGALAEARQRRDALERAREAGGEAEARAPSSSLELANRLVRVLEQRRETQIQIDALEAGREAIEAALARDPSEIVGVPPPFPVPTLDGVLSAWRREVEQQAQQRVVLEDRRANLELAEEAEKDLAKQRRRLRDVIQGEKDEVERIRLETELRSLEDRLAIAREQAALARQYVKSAEIEAEIKSISANQAEAALAWVESQLAPRETDLTDAIERLDRERYDLDRRLDLARADLVSAEGALRAAEERAPRVAGGDRAGYEVEVATRRAQLAHRQTIVALLAERIERIGRMRVSWQRRYTVLGDRLDLGEAPRWRDGTELELERLTRLRRIHETELAEARLALANLLRRATEPDPNAPNAPRFLELEFADLERLVALYETDLDSLDRAIRLEERLRVELLARLKNRDLGERVRSLWETVRSFWSYELVAMGDSAITPGKILIALAVFVLGLRLARLLRRLLSRRLFPSLGFDAGASSAFGSLAFYGLLAVAFLFALRAVNIPLTAFAVAGGALAIGIGFGSQQILSNFISGLLLLAERPIRAGDLVEVGGVVGTVDSIGLRSTRIQTPDNFHIIVPNASFLESNVVNWTHEDPNIRLRVVVGVAYGSPTRRVEELLLEVAREHPRSLPSPEPIAVFKDFGDSALLFEVRFWIRYDERTDRSRIQSDVRYRIDELFAENDITIAFPQMDVHLDVVAAGPDTGGES